MTLTASALAWMATVVAVHAAGDPSDQIYALRFSGLTLGKAPTVSVYARDATGVWNPGQMVAVGNSKMFLKYGMPPFAECLAENLGSLGEQAQLPTLNRYVLTEDWPLMQAVSYLLNSKDFMNRPFRSYFYMSNEPSPHDLSGLGAAGYYPMFRFDFNRLAKEWQLPGSENLPENIRGGLWMISGQMVKGVPVAGMVDMQFEPLPWMADPNYLKQIGKDQASYARYVELRKKYKVMWEIGRASSTGPGQYEEMMGLAGTDMLKELFHYGARPTPELFESAAVNLHTMTKSGYESVRKRFPDDSFIYMKGDPKNPYDVVFIVPLKKYLEVFPPKNFNARQAIFDRLHIAEGSPLLAQHFMQLISFFANAPLDFVYKGKPMLPLEFNTLNSGTIDGMIRQVGTGLKIPNSDLNRLIDGGFSPSVGTADPFMPGVVVDPAMPNVLDIAKQYHAFQVANLDPAIAAKDPEFGKAALVAAFDHLVMSMNAMKTPLTRYSPEVWGIANDLQTGGAHFMITTHYPETAKQLRTLGAEYSPTVDLKNNQHAQAYWQQQKGEANLNKPSDTEYTFVFSINQILQFRDEIYRKAEGKPSELPQAIAGRYWLLSGILAP